MTSKFNIACCKPYNKHEGVEAAQKNSNESMEVFKNAHKRITKGITKHRLQVHTDVKKPLASARQD